MQYFLKQHFLSPNAINNSKLSSLHLKSAYLRSFKYIKNHYAKWIKEFATLAEGCEVIEKMALPSMGWLFWDLLHFKSIAFSPGVALKKPELSEK